MSVFFNVFFYKRKKTWDFKERLFMELVGLFSMSSVTKLKHINYYKKGFGDNLQNVS